MENKQQELAELIRTVAKNIESASPNNVSLLIQPIRDFGIESNVHLGRKDMLPKSLEELEWFAGQLLDIVEHKSWFAVNSWINCVDKFTLISE